MIRAAQTALLVAPEPQRDAAVRAEFVHQPVTPLAVAKRDQPLGEQLHPDWRTVAQSPDFAGWLQIQPDNIQRLASSWDARETSVVLTLFKAERAEATGQKPQQEAPAKEEQQQAKPDAATGVKRSQQLDGGRDVRSRPAPAASGPPEDFDAAFKYFTEKRRLAASRGV